LFALLLRDHRETLANGVVRQAFIEGPVGPRRPGRGGHRPRTVHQHRRPRLGRSRTGRVGSVPLRGGCRRGLRARGTADRRAGRPAAGERSGKGGSGSRTRRPRVQGPQKRFNRLKMPLVCL
jgi:hypothetical protein